MAGQLHEYDVVVIGGGPGGYASALYGASAGLRVALVEKDAVGGTCLHRGCIPAKELLETAAVRRAVTSAAQFGVMTGTSTLDFATSQSRKGEIVGHLARGLAGLLKGRKVDVFQGVGRFNGSAADVSVTTEGGEISIHGESVIVATGSVPREVPAIPTDGSRVMNSDHLLEMERPPESVMVVGAGAIGCEFASMLSDLGSRVVLVEATDRALAGCDDDIAKVVLRSFKKRGIELFIGESVAGAETTPGGTRVTLESGASSEVEKVLIAVGRSPLTADLGLDSVGVETDSVGFVTVDEACRTTREGIWAVGDVIRTPQLAHVAFAEGMVAVRGVLGESPRPIDYARVPWCIYTHPEVAFVGQTEAAARASGAEIVVSKHRYAGNGRAMILGETDGLVKLIAEKRPDGTAGRILGVHAAGPWATEQLGQGYMAVNWEATVDDLAAFIQPHPTLGEVFGEAAMALTGRSLH